MVIIITIIICYCVCVLFQVGAQFSSVSAYRGERKRLEKAYITVSIVTCSIVPKNARGNCRNDELHYLLRPEMSGNNT